MNLPNGYEETELWKKLATGKDKNNIMFPLRMHKESFVWQRSVCMEFGLVRIIYM